MAVQHLTLIEYIPRSGRCSKELELQEAIVRAHVARVNHARRRNTMSKHAQSKNSEVWSRRNELRLVQHNITLEEASFTDSNYLYQDEQPEIGNEVASPSITCITSPVEETAINFTLAKLIQGSYFEYIPLLRSRVPTKGILSITIRCIALATFGRHTRQDDLLFKARSLHQKALRRIRTALNNIDVACQDETLASVLLVAYYGLVDGNASCELTATRAKHLRGALSILQMRSAKGISSDIGDRMVLQTWDNIIMQSHCKQMRLPIELPLLQKSCLSYSGRRTWTTESEHCVYAYSQRTAELRAAVHEKSLTNPIAVIAEALDLLADGEKIHNEMQEIWPYTTRTTDPELEGVYQGMYYVYPNGQSAWMLSGFYRISTIWLRGIVVDFAQEILERDKHGILSESLPAVDELIRKSKSEIERIALDICACAPQHLDPSFVKNKYQQIWMRIAYKQSRFIMCPELSQIPSTEARSPSTQSAHDQQHIPSACSLLWPLYVAGSATESESLRQYTINRLRYIGNSCNVQLATMAADKLENGEFGDEDGLDMAYAI